MNSSSLAPNKLDLPQALREASVTGSRAAALAGLLGARRQSVTLTAAKLQKDGVLRHGRGRITVLDRHALERHVCECYGVVDKEYRRLMPRLAAICCHVTGGAQT
jgi:hypothetical protein